MIDKKVAIIGGGNLGQAISTGLLDSQKVKPENMQMTRRKSALLAPFAQLGVKTGSDNCLAVRESELIILAVKPKTIVQVLDEIKEELEPNKHILISVVTGYTLKDMYYRVEKKLPLFRAMPNTAIAIRESMTCISQRNAEEKDIQLVQELFNALGKTVLIEDDLMAAATVLGACGIAYSMRYIRACSQGGIEIGFGAETAQVIAAQMVKGAAALLLENGNHPEQEIDKVTTPQGCTIVGLNEMEHQGFSSALIKGVISSYHKIADIKDSID